MKNDIFEWPTKPLSPAKRFVWVQLWMGSRMRVVPVEIRIEDLFVPPERGKTHDSFPSHPKPPSSRPGASPRMRQNGGGDIAVRPSERPWLTLVAPPPPTS